MNISRTAMALALGIAAASINAHAQTTQGGAQPAATSPAQPRDTASGGAQKNTAGKESQLQDQDQQFLEDATQGSYAEIEGSKLALEKTQNQDVKHFADMMIKDHTAMVQEVSKLATDKGMTPPDGPSVMQVTEVTALKALTGGAFDAMYVNRIGVASHEATVKLFEQASEKAQDPDVKALAAKSLPKLREHLEMARALDKKQDNKSSK